jgi:ribosomal subunit interface protein
MKISMFGHETIITDEVREYTVEKMNKLEKFNINIMNIDVTLEENHHLREKSNAYLAKCLVQIPGEDLSAKAEGRTLFAAVDDLESKITNQIMKLKEKKILKRTKLAKSKSLLRKLLRQ